ncbi:DUF2264 domain-containing protein [Streptomyces coelicoflavus]|uniref:DUF2264 domain-containing protein n=1 Tax=Streptomyces coelicoflavus TaxID=285562 RepID=UPI0036D17D57
MNAAPPPLRLPFPIPPLDSVTAPVTGLGREHWEAVADGLVEAAWRHASPCGGRLDLPGRASVAGVRSDGLEGYARTFLAAAFRVAGAQGADPHGFLGRYADGLAAGTLTPGRDDPDSWPRIVDYPRGGQPMVESASVALSLHLTRPWLWDRLDPTVQQRAADWLHDCVTHACPPSNWQFFPYTVASFLESVGRGDAHTARVRQRALDAVRAWDRGEGWYSDGDLAGYDHYNGWALHLYPVLDSLLRGDDGLRAEFGGRLTEHLRTYSLTFDLNGAPLHLGRSLTYRFAAGAAHALAAVSGLTPLTPGESRWRISSTLRYFLDRGAVDPDGLLSLGWHGPHRGTVQRYSGPGSPYWASKAFVALLAGPEHPLWTAEEQPAEPEDRVVAVRAPGWLIQTTAPDGLVRVHQHGNDHLPASAPETYDGVDIHYNRFAYSTRTGPTAADNPPDNQLTLMLPCGSATMRRRVRSLGCGVDDLHGVGWAASTHVPVLPPGSAFPVNLRVVSATVCRGLWELRVHRMDNAPEGTEVRVSGWATGTDTGLCSTLVPLTGLRHDQPTAAPDGTAFSPYVRVPLLTGRVAGTALVAALAALSADPAGPSHDAVEMVESGSDFVIVRWVSDGLTTHIRLRPDGVRVDSGYRTV